MARQTKIYQVKFETDGFKAVARSFQSINGQIDQTLKHHKEAQKIGLQQARDDRGRFVRSRLGLNFQRDDRFIQRKNGDNEFRSRSKGRFSVDHQESGAGRSQLEASAKIQGEIIGQHVAQAIRASLRGETQAEIDSNSIQSAIKSGFEFALSSTFSGAFQRIGEETIADPVLNAMRQAFAENRKIENAQRKNNTGVNPVKQASNAVGFAGTSIAFGAFQQIGSRFSADLVNGFIKGFDKRADKAFNFSLERRGEIFGGTVVDFAKNIGKDIDEASEDLKRSGNDFAKTAKATAKVAMQPFDTAIRAYRNNALDTVAVQRARERAAQQEKQDFSGKEEAVFVVGGFAARQGKAGVGIARTIRQNVDQEKTAVVPVTNEFTDITTDAVTNPQMWAAEVAAKVAAITSQGFNEDAVNMAAQAAAVKRDNPEIKIRLIGHSAGGFVAEEAQQILQMMGIESESLALGTPNALGGLRAVGQKKYIGVEDPFAKYNKALEQIGLAHPFEPLETVYGHSFPDYNVPEVYDLISKHKKKPKAKAKPTVVPDQPMSPRNIPIELAPDTPRPQQIPIEIPEQGFPDTTSIVDRQFQRVEELRQLARAFQPQQPGQTGLWQSNRPIPPGMVPDLTPASIRSLIADAQAQFQQMRPSQLAANQEPQIRPTRSEELPQLIQAYQRSILEAFERSQEEMLRSLRDTITNLSQAPVELDQEGFADTIRSSLSEQARKLIRVYDQAIGAIVGVSADPSTINQGNFSTELEQLREDTAAIMLRFREGIAQNFQETAALLQSLAQSYESESPAQLAGGGRQPYTENFNEIIQDQLTEYQRNIRKLFAEVAQSTAADFTDLRRLRAQLGLPAQAPKAGLSTRYNDRIQNLISGARTSAQERVRGLIPGFQELSPKQRSAELKKMRSQLTQGLAEFRSTMATGDQNAARQLGEGLLQRIEAIRAAYEDLGKNFTGDKRGLGAQKGQLTKQSKEIQARLKTIADNATGSLAAAIEADLGEVGSAGQSIGDALIEGAEESLEISSPSQVFQRIGANIARGLGIGLRENLEEVKQDLTDNLSELGEESAFQATRVVNKFNDMGGLPGLDEKAAQGIEMVRDRLSGLVQEFPAIQQLLQLGTEFGGSIALLMLSFNAIGSILKATGIGQFFNAIATLPETAGEAGRELQSLGIAFESVTGSSALAADAMQYVSDTAEKFGINIRAAEEAYLGLVATTRGTELEGFQTQKIFEAFAQTAALRGLDQQQQQQMFVAVQQVLGKGKLSAEEVRGQLGEIPALAFQQTLASSLGVNLQQLDKLLSTGQLQSDALFKVAQAYESANAQMAGASETATAALARFDNAIVQLQRSVGAEFLAVQTQGAKAFTSALNGITNAIPAIVGTIKSGLIVVLSNFVIQVFSSATAVKLLRMVLVTLVNTIQRLLPMLAKMAVAIAAVNAAIEVWTGLLEPFQQDETGKAIRNLSLRYQELAGSIESASEAQKELDNTNLWDWATNFRERSLDIQDSLRSSIFQALSQINNPLAARFASSAREEAAYNRLNLKLAESSEQISTTATAQVLNKEAIDAAEKMLKIQQQINLAKTIASGLAASDAEGLAAVNESLKELRSQYDVYLKQIGDVRAASEESIKNAKEQIKILEQERENPYLGDYAKTQIDQKINGLLEQIELLQSGQKELDAVTSRFEVTLADFTTALKRGIERLANFRERLTNQINEERARLLETGLGLGKGEQTIRLELDRQDFRELEEWVRTLRIESQKITDRLRDPILADQERNLREQADREGVDFGTAFLQRIVEENTQNTEAAQQLLELQNLQNQITEGEVQLQQQALQARQSVRDMTRSVTDFLRQLEQELAEITLQLQEQIQALQQQFRRSQLQKAIVAGSTGMFGSITSSVQGFLDAAGEIAQKYLGQERRKLEFEQKKYDLTTRLRDFSEGLAGATEALATFKNGLTGASGASSPGTARPSSMGETFLGITGDTGIGSGAHLDIRKRGGDRRLTAAEINRFLVDGKPLSSYPITSEFGPRNTGIPGASTDHRGVDFGIDIGKKITTTVPVRRVSMREPSQTGGGGYVVDVLFEDGLEVSLLHQSPEIKTAGIGTSSRSPITGASSVSGATAELLARIRSGEGDYTSINRGRAGDTPGGMPGLANMTIAQVMALQARGEAFAVGAYQFIPDTLQGAVTRSGIDRNRKFDKAAQDQLALELILGGTKRPHLTAYLTGKSNDLNAALSDISHEWAAVTGASGRGAYDGDSAGNMASISVADLLPQVRAQVQGQGAQSVPSEVARSQQLGTEILATQRSQMAASEGEISVAVLDLVQQRKNVLEEVRRLLETSTRDLGVSVTGMSNQMQQYTNPDALLGIQTQVRQQFDDFNLQLYTESQRVGDSIAELQGIIATYPPVIEQLRATNDPVDAEQASLLQGTVDMAKTYLTALEAIDKRLDETQKRSQEAYQKEREYLIQKNQLETENTELALELEIAQTNRNSSLETELAIQQERNNLALQLLEIERQFANRPDELARQQELLRLQSEQRIQTLQFEEQRRALEERSFQTELQTRLNEAQAAQAEGQFGDNGIFGFRATALREENALLQEQIRYEQEVLALRERYRDQPDVLGRMLDQAAQLNQVNLQNIDTQFKDLGETIAEVAEDALGQFFEDIFSGTKSAGEAFRNLAQSILRYFAQMAARNLARGIFSKLGGAFGGFLGGGGGAAFTSPAGWSGFAYGGTVPNYAEGDRVVPDTIAEVMRSLVPGVDAGFRREGSRAALGIFTPGEEILSLKTGEAQRYQLLKRSLGKNPLQAIMSGSFAYGGTVGINPDILTGDLGIRSPLVPVSSVLQMQSQRSSTGGGNVTINYEIKTPDANSFRRSQYQIDKDATIAAKQVLNRK
ncbi:MAG: tape measure protein [Prochlorotrichaceae cyanobacterium]